MLRRVGKWLDFKSKKVVLVTLISGLVLFLIVNFNGKSLDEDNKSNGGSNLTFEQQIKNFGEKQTSKVPKDYTPEEAMENGDITPTNRQHPYK
ncbi:hypothetical protein [Oceanobacillus sp. CF4.6]|uniref:hypothetical protein n=1 Tax=Oceanobacillus sp. CF4.6 TaxID=3373080 RepID=UPI003EE7CDF9